MAWAASRVAYDDVVRLVEELAVPEPMAWVLARRGLGDPKEALAFLRSDGPLDPPEAIPGIPEAADRIAQAVREGQRIVVHGDYDCDGICSTAILVDALQARGANVGAFLPSRFTDGYGVNVATVERLADEGCRLLVTVDCGTTAVEALERAAELGIDSVVCDHHLAGGRRPPAIIANPALGRGSDALPAAAGVTFKLTQALAARLDGDRLAPDVNAALDLVALATVADAVPLIGENRRLVARGIAAIRAQPRPGIAALCAAAGVSPRAVDARALGWNLAPAINAAGRMAHPEQALEVLLGGENPHTTDMAVQLWNLNMERREVEQRVTQEAIAIIEASPQDVTDAHAIVVAGEGWHEGVVGIVASRLVDRFSRPAIVVTVDGDSAKGSGRSLPGVDLHALVASADGPLDRWGGHAGAIGLQLPAGQITAFRDGLTLAAEPFRAAITRARVRHVDAVVSIRDLTLANAEALEALQPFGTGNPEIRLLIPAATVETASTMGEGGRHLQMRLASAGVHARALGWSMGERASRIAVGDRHDVVVQLGVDRWQELVGPRVTVDSIDALGDAERLPGDCAQACDVVCTARITAEDAIRPRPEPQVAGASSPPRAVHDRRGQGAVVATLTALAGADRGVAAVVCDTARRRNILERVLAPQRLGVEAAVLAGTRCARLAMAARLAGVADRPLVAMVDYASLSDVELPPGIHVALVDPPADARSVDAVAAIAADRHLHLLWGEPETAFTRSLVERRLDVRAAAADIWRVVSDGELHPWGADLDAALFGTQVPMSDPVALAAGARALQQLGRLEITDEGLRGIHTSDGARIADTACAQEMAAKLATSLALLDRAMTLSFAPSAISSLHV